MQQGHKKSVSTHFCSMTVFVGVPVFMSVSSAECCNEELIACLDHASIAVLEWINGAADCLKAAPDILH